MSIMHLSIYLTCLCFLSVMFNNPFLHYTNRVGCFLSCWVHVHAILSDFFSNFFLNCWCWHIKIKLSTLTFYNANLTNFIINLNTNIFSFLCSYALASNDKFIFLSIFTHFISPPCYI